MKYLPHTIPQKDWYFDIFWKYTHFMKQTIVYKNKGEETSDSLEDQKIAKYLDILKRYQSLIPSVNKQT